MMTACIKSSSLIVQRNNIPLLQTSPQIVLYDAEHKIVKTVRSKVPGVKLTDLSPGTTYYIAVRGNL